MKRSTLLWFTLALPALAGASLGAMTLSDFAGDEAYDAEITRKTARFRGYDAGNLNDHRWTVLHIYGESVTPAVDQNGVQQLDAQGNPMWNKSGNDMWLFPEPCPVRSVQPATKVGYYGTHAIVTIQYPEDAADVARIVYVPGDARLLAHMIAKQSNLRITDVTQVEAP